MDSKEQDKLDELHTIQQGLNTEVIRTKLLNMVNQIIPIITIRR